MYNETYHKLSEENLNYVLGVCKTEEQKESVKEQVQEATKNKTHNYRITIVPPNADGKGGVWFDIENGIPKASSNQ